ncbi:MAG: thiol-disulfide isomerase/thioredoxin [Arcticibacterium sp.]
MKKTLAFVLVLVGFNVFGQGVQFPFKDMPSALSDARVSEKLVFLDVYAAWCGPCRAMETSIFTKPEVGDFFNASFSNLKMDSDMADGRSVALKYGVKEFPTYLFLSPEGEIVHKIVGFHSSGRLLSEAEKAKRKKAEFISIRNLDAEYEKGKREPDFLYKYLKRKTFEEGSQPFILEEYLEVVPEDEIRTEKVLALISDNVTSVSSKGFTILSESLSRFLNMTESQQKAILRGISNSKKSTFKTAVKERDDELFDILIEAVHNTSYSRQAAFAEERQFRYDYAKLTRNFKFFKIIAQEEASQIMTKSLEDFQEQTAMSIREFERTAEEKGISASSGRYKMMLAGLEKGASRAASFQLNDFARGYFEMATDEMDLKNAIKWSAYSIKLEETAANWETYSFLLKKVDRKRDAKKAMKQAIRMAKRAGLETEILKRVYKKIK